MEFFFKYTWIFFIIGTIINGIVFKIRSEKYITANPELKPGYDKLIKGWLVFGNIPWIIIGIGNLSGITNSIWDYFNPKSLNPMVLVFHLSIIIIWILGSRWIYLKGGAEFLVRHPGLVKFNGPGFSNNIESPTAIKIFWGVCLLGGIAGMIMMWVMDIPKPMF